VAEDLNVIGIAPVQVSVFRSTNVRAKNNGPRERGQQRREALCELLLTTLVEEVEEGRGVNNRYTALERGQRSQGLKSREGVCGTSLNGAPGAIMLESKASPTTKAAGNVSGVDLKSMCPKSQKPGEEISDFCHDQKHLSPRPCCKSDAMTLRTGQPS